MLAERPEVLPAGAMVAIVRAQPTESVKLVFVKPLHCGWPEEAILQTFAQPLPDVDQYRVGDVIVRDFARFRNQKLRRQANILASEGCGINIVKQGQRHELAIEVLSLTISGAGY